MSLHNAAQCADCVGNAPLCQLARSLSFVRFQVASEASTRQERRQVSNVNRNLREDFLLTLIRKQRERSCSTKFIQIAEHAFLTFGVLIDLIEHHSSNKALAARVCFSFTGRDTRADTPGPVGWLEMTAPPLLQFRTVARDPAPHCRVVCLQAALAEEFFDITASRNESEYLRYPRTVQRISSGSVCRHLKIAGRMAFFMISSGYQPPSAKVCNTTIRYQRPANRRFRSVLRCAITHYRQVPSLSAP